MGGSCSRGIELTTVHGASARAPGLLKSGLLMIYARVGLSYTAAVAAPQTIAQHVILFYKRLKCACRCCLNGVVVRGGFESGVAGGRAYHPWQCPVPRVSPSLECPRNGNRRDYAIGQSVNGLPESGLTVGGRL